MVRITPRDSLTATLCPYTPPFLSPGRAAAGTLRDRNRQRRRAALQPLARPGAGARTVRLAADGGNPRRHDRLRSHLSLGNQPVALWRRSEEHTSELQSLMRISYAVFCL